MERFADTVPQRLQFGSFELDLRTRELRKHGLKVKISPQALCVLTCLLERRGEPVTRDELFQRLWPADTHVEFEGNLNAIVRVLREALGDSARNPRFIETEPKMGYRFIAPVSGAAVAVRAIERVEPAPPRRWNYNWLAIPITGLAALGLVALWRWPARESVTPRAPLTQITHLLGQAGHPSFSPDGTQIAFQWRGEERSDFDIYALRIGSEDMRRLTTDPANEIEPAWSPDGRDIAFLRDLPDGQCALMLVPAPGGPERRVAVLPKVRSFAWSPDGGWIAYALAAQDNPLNPAANHGLSAISLATGQTVEITPSERGTSDSFPAFSANGRQLAFVRHNDIWTVPIDDTMRVRGAARQITFHGTGASRPQWTPDDEHLIFTADSGSEGKLWRVSTSARPSAPTDLSGDSAFEPVVDRGGRKLVYSRSTLVDSLNTLEVCAPGCTPEPPKKLLYSVRLARNPSYSPDGSQIAFESSRSGRMEIWLCGRDGSNARQLTHLGGSSAGSPSWSPDGKSLVFDARVERGSAIFVIAASGGTPRQLTSGATEDLVPSWSIDGRRIFFASKRTGQLQVWSMTAEGANPVQITRRGGFRAVASPDGKYLYYSEGATQTSLWRIPLSGGPEIQVIPSLSYWQNFSVATGGIFFTPYSDSRSIPIRFYDGVRGTSRLVASVDSASLQGLSASPDQQGLVFSRRESNSRDLMLMELPR